MREYKTQMEAARKGIVTEELKKVAQKEHLRVEELMPLVAAGKVAICANKNHKCLDPQGVGSMLRTKINVNLGVSRDWKDYDIEMQKSYGSGGYGSGRNHGSVFPWRYYRIPEKTDFGMSGDDWNCTGIRFCDTLSERPGNTHGKRFY